MEERIRRYVYGMRLRGASPGAQPSGLKDIQNDPTGTYYNIIIYDRKLSEAEVRGYELDYLGEE